jgi:hypothetical protein
MAHVHHWVLATSEVATDGKCECGEVRLFKGGYDHTNLKSGNVWFNENDRKRIIKAILQ